MKGYVIGVLLYALCSQLFFVEWSYNHLILDFVLLVISGIIVEFFKQIMFYKG